MKRARKKGGVVLSAAMAACFTLSMLAFTEDYYRVLVCLIEKYAWVVVSVKK